MSLRIPNLVLCRLSEMGLKYPWASKYIQCVVLQDPADSTEAKFEKCLIWSLAGWREDVGGDGGYIIKMSSYEMHGCIDFGECLNCNGFLGDVVLCVYRVPMLGDHKENRWPSIMTTVLIFALHGFKDSA